MHMNMVNSARFSAKYGLNIARAKVNEWVNNLVSWL